MMLKNKHPSAGAYQELCQLISGDVYTDQLRRQLLSTDGSIFRKQPCAVVYPRATDDVRSVVRFARRHGLTVHSRGAGSGLCGSAIGHGIILDFSKYMNRLVHLDTDAQSFTCQPGFRLGELEKALQDTGLFFPPDPSSGEYATFGGMYATNASGAHSVKYGNVADYIIDARIVFSDGSVGSLAQIADAAYENLPGNLKKLFQLYEANAAQIETAYPATRFNTAGYNLRHLVGNGALRLHRLLAGSEGTLGVVTQLTFRLLPQPAHNSLVAAYMDDIVSSARAVQALLPQGPAGIEVMDKSLLRLAKSQDPRLRDSIPSDVDNVLLIEFDAFEPAECAQQAAAARELLQTRNYTQRVHTAVSEPEKKAFWAVRKAAVPILYKLKGEKKILALIEDAAVPTDRLVDYFKGVYAILQRHDVEFVTYGHIAKGLLHTRPLLNLKRQRDVNLLRAIADDLYELVHGLNGSISGEHGDGRLRSPYIHPQYAPIYDLFLETKALLDPHGMLNPEIITHHDPDQMKKHLRYGADYIRYPLKRQRLNWPENACREIEKCHGCTKCTTVTNVTRMCPVYKITRDEAAAPKAKANILRGLISGHIDSQTLYANAFQEIMRQCVNCGSCSVECPSEVNIPKLALEARAQYTAQFGTVLQDRLLTSLEDLARPAHRLAPRFAPLMNLSFTRRMGERFTGVSAKRDLPIPAATALQDRRLEPIKHGDITVLYFAGCDASYLRPSIGQAAHTVLSRMNMAVHIPDQHCCGLPMLSKGMDRQARQKIQANLAKWRALAAKADYIVVTCSSCGYALTKEWRYLLESPDMDMIGAKTIHITRLINFYFDRLKLNPGQAIPSIAYHAPCHLRIQPNSDCSLKLLERMDGADIQDLKGNCCGMAGSWGMTAPNFELSRTIGADMISRLNRSGAAIGVTDCPTCRLQMEQFSDRPIYHPIEVIGERLVG